MQGVVDGWGRRGTYSPGTDDWLNTEGGVDTQITGSMQKEAPTFITVPV